MKARPIQIWVTLLLLTGCAAPPPSGVKAIVGARLEAEGKPVIEYSVVVIAEGKFRAVGPQATTPVPKGSEISGGPGRVLRGKVEAGQPADLVVVNTSTGAVEATMHNGEWVK